MDSSASIHQPAHPTWTGAQPGLLGLSAQTAVRARPRRRSHCRATPGIEKPKGRENLSQPFPSFPPSQGRGDWKAGLNLAQPCSTLTDLESAPEPEPKPEPKPKPRSFLLPFVSVWIPMDSKYIRWESTGCPLPSVFSPRTEA